MSRMRVSTELTLGLGLVGLVIFGAYGVYQGTTEAALLRRALAREMELVAKSVEVGVENALRDHQLADIQETLERLETIDSRIDILVFDKDAELKAGSGDPGLPSATVQGLAAAALAANQMTLLWEPPGAAGRLVASLPLVDDDGSLQGSLLVVRPLQDLDQALDRARRNILVAAGLLVVMLGLVSLWLSTFLVRQPLFALVTAIRRLRSEGQAKPVSTGAGAEIHELVREFNLLLGDLKDARSRLEAESESRLRLEAGLRRVDKLVTMGQLSAGLAHEIGSPLQILSGRASALLSRADDGGAVRHNAAIIVKECERITHIVEQLLAFARRRAPAMTELDLGETVHAVVDLLSVEAKRRGVALSVAQGDQSIHVKGDHEQLQQVVINLLSNALAATPQGGEVSLALESGVGVRVGVGVGVGTSAGVRLVVTDTGRGMPQETLDRLFEPFFTTRTDEGGTGLGLAVVKAIVTDHGGRVSAKSEPGLGSQFTVELPWRAGEAGDDATMAVDPRGRTA